MSRPNVLCLLVSSTQRIGPACDSPTHHSRITTGKKTRLTGRPKVAVTTSLLDKVSVQTGSLPLQPPLQASNIQPVTAVAVRVTAVSGSKVSVQSVAPPPQVMPGGELVTMPSPSPAMVTARLR